MKRDDNGFLFPVNTGRDSIEIEKLSLFCPGIMLEQRIKKKGIEQIYGPLQEPIKIAYSCDSELRRSASSGGAITAILLYLLENDLIDGVLQIGADPENPLINKAFFNQTPEDIKNSAGSRYAPSSLLENLLEYLEAGKRMAIVGKPCDIAGVKQYVRCFGEYEENVVMTLALMCMGLPSYKATDKLIEYLNPENKPVKKFRYRGDGWPGFATVTTYDDEKLECSYNDSWGKILSRDILFRCKICPDGFGEFADVSSGDAWHLVNGEPCFDERDGRSLLFIRNRFASKIVKDAISKGYLAVEKYNFDELKLIQKSQYFRKQVVGARLLALKVMGDKLLSVKGFNLFNNMLRAGFRACASNFLGTIKRRMQLSLKKLLGTKQVCGKYDDSPGLQKGL